MNRDARIAAAPHAAFRRLSGAEGGVLLHLESTAYFRVNELGATIWQVVQEGVTLEALVQRVRGTLDAPPADLADDVTQFIEDLAARDLVVIAPVS